MKGYIEFKTGRNGYRVKAATHCWELHTYLKSRVRTAEDVAKLGGKACICDGYAPIGYFRDIPSLCKYLLNNEIKTSLVDRTTVEEYNLSLKLITKNMIAALERGNINRES